MAENTKSTSAASHGNNNKGANAKRKQIINFPIIVILCYIFTVTIFLQIKVSKSVASSADEPFLNHFDSIGGGTRSKQNSCSKNAFYTLETLIKKINENQGQNAMIPLDIPAAGAAFNPQGNVTITMPGLHLDFFKNKRVALLGDSTMFYLGKFLVSMLLHQDKVGEPVEYHKMNMQQANGVVQKNKQFILKGTAAPPPYRADNGRTWFAWWGMQGNAHGRTEELIDRMFASADTMKPEVVVVNMAFHWFHLCGYSEKMCPSQLDLPILSRWLLYKETWLQRSYDFAEKQGAKVLLYKTANYICSSRRTGDWLTGDTLYQNMDNATITACVERLVPLVHELIGVTPEDVAKYCKYGQFTEVGSKYLNEQMVDFVRTIQDDEHRDSNMIVGLYNDHDVENCGTTEDAIHHRIAITTRARLLTNTIDSYLKCHKER